MLETPYLSSRQSSGKASGTGPNSGNSKYLSLKDWLAERVAAACTRAMALTDLHNWIMSAATKLVLPVEILTFSIRFEKIIFMLKSIAFNGCVPKCESFEPPQQALTQTSSICSFSYG
jgi:hypothetical protein